MKQHEAVILTLERLGGQATLGMLYREVMRIKECKWGTKTPFASIRRIVQTRAEVFRVRPGLWALRSYQSKLGLCEESRTRRTSEARPDNAHSYYQGLLTTIGNLRGFATYLPNQDKNKLFVDRPLGTLRSMPSLPTFSYEQFVRRTATVDVVWFNSRRMPDSLFEVEHSTEIQGSLVKFCELRDFYARMVIVADGVRRPEFKSTVQKSALEPIRSRVRFLDYETLAKEYEHQVFMAGLDFAL